MTARGASPKLEMCIGQDSIMQDIGIGELQETNRCDPFGGYRR